jgi:Tol biopolymer transport system component
MPSTGHSTSARPGRSLPGVRRDRWYHSRAGPGRPTAKSLPESNIFPTLHSGIGVYDPASGSYDWFTDFGDWPVWLNDNRRMLFVSQGKIFLFDTATRKYEPVLTVTDQDVDIGSPSLSPDNKTLYFTFVSAEADIWLMSLE